MRTLGFLTRDDTSDLPPGFCPPGWVVVFVQWSSQIGGYCFLMPRDRIHELPISVEQGMRWALTGGLTLGRNEQDDDAEAATPPPPTPGEPAKDPP